ncbi:MAG: hypothetical protein IKW39_04775 [Alphaproteobacteria bacterium]|nr:hypothetical protein [Alphaproteobacteria bacterium]
MKSIRILTLILPLLSGKALANNSYIEDVKSFGYVAGEGLACGAERYPTYELIARTFLVSSAKSDEEQAKGMFEYNSAKAEAYMSKKQDGLFGCNEINQRFNNQNIFNSKLYKNGKLKLPDGKVIIPRQKYNPNYLYDRSKDERSVLNAYYDKIIAKRNQKAKKEGIYQKIRQQENSR